MPAAVRDGWWRGACPPCWAPGGTQHEEGLVWAPSPPSGCAVRPWAPWRRGCPALAASRARRRRSRPASRPAGRPPNSNTVLVPPAGRSPQATFCCSGDFWVGRPLPAAPGPQPAGGAGCGAAARRRPAVTTAGSARATVAVATALGPGPAGRAGPVLPSTRAGGGAGSVRPGRASAAARRTHRGRGTARWRESAARPGPGCPS